MWFLYIFLQIAFSLKIFPTKVALFSSCVFVCVSSNCLWSEIFSHKNCNFFLMWFLYIFLQIAFGPKNFPTKVAFFSTCVFCMCFLKLPSSWKIFPQKFHFFSCFFCMCFFKFPLVPNIFPQKLHFFLHVFFVYVSSNCLWSETFSHKNCNFFFMLFFM